MNSSDSINELAAALHKAQAAMPVAPMSGRNPHLKNRYATLGDIIATAQPVLAAHGLSYVQMVEGDGGAVCLTTRLMHTSGQWLEGAACFPVDAGANRAVSPAQAAGSVITYMRRYALAAMLGIVADEDADGNAPEPTRDAPRPEAKPQGQRPAAPAKPVPAEMVYGDGTPVPDNDTTRAIFAEFWNLYQQAPKDAEDLKKFHAGQQRRAK